MSELEGERLVDIWDDMEVEKRQAALRQVVDRAEFKDLLLSQIDRFAEGSKVRAWLECL